MYLSVNAETGNGLDCGGLFLHGRGFAFEQPYRDWLCRFLILHTALRKGYLWGVKCPDLYPLQQTRLRKPINVLPFIFMERCLFKSSDRLTFTNFREVDFEATKRPRGFIVFRPTSREIFRAKGPNRVNWALQIESMRHLRSNLGRQKR
jgi:hypothetical protein